MSKGGRTGSGRLSSDSIRSEHSYILRLATPTPYKDVSSTARFYKREHEGRYVSRYMMPGHTRSALTRRNENSWSLPSLFFGF